MDGDHDIDQCYTVSEWTLKTGSSSLLSEGSRSKHGLKPNMAIPARSAEAGLGRGRLPKRP